MKKILSILLTVIMVSTLSLTAFGALPSDNPVGGSSREVKQTVQNVEVEGYLCTDVAKEVFDIVNEERAAAGVAAIKWNSKLDSAAQTRALEQYVQPSHTRPDGSHFSTVSSLANNENLAGGTDPSIFDAAGVMDGWMNSQGHRETLLNPAYVSMSVACVYTDQGIYWTQVFSRTAVDGTTTTPTNPDPTDPNIGGSGSGSSSGGSSKADTGRFTSATASKSSNTAVQASTDSTQLKISDGSAKKADVLTVAEIQNYSGKKLTVNADTLVSGKVNARLYISPISLSARTTDYKLGVHTNSKIIATIQSRFAKNFKNKLVVVEIEERDLTVSTHVAVKVDLTGFNTDSLSFYTYSATDNKYYPLVNTGYSIDNNGYLHFYTATGGYIIITDQPLKK